MRMPRRGTRLVLILAIILAGVPAWPAGAQLSDEDANRTAASTVMLSALLWQEKDGVTTRFKECFLGSGSVVSADGRLIITNSHVVGNHNSAKSFAEAEGAIVDERIVVSIVDHRRDIPVPQYGARLVKDDPTLDLAVLRITGDAPPGIEHDLPIGRSPLEPGRSTSANQVTLFGYPELEAGDVGCAAIPSGTIRSYEGAVSGFSGSTLDVLEVDVTASFGNSGGSAVDEGGRLIGVPTNIRSMAGGGVVEVIPIERAMTFLAGIFPEEFGSAISPTPGAATVTPVAPIDTPEPPTQEPALPSPPSGTADSSGGTSFPVYDVGETVVTTDVANLRAEATSASAIVEILAVDTLLEISGPAVADADPQLDWWPVMNPSTGMNGFVREDLLARPASGAPAVSGNLARPGAMPGAGPISEPTIRWRASVSSDGDLAMGSDLVVAGSMLYFTSLGMFVAEGGRALTVHAVDTATGQEHWQVQPTTSIGIGNPAVSGELVYVAGEDGVHALDAVTGEERWQAETSGGGGNPVVGGGVVYVDSFFGVHALDAATGEERWRAAINEVPRKPVVAGDTVYINSDDVSSTENRRGFIYAFDAETGGDRWRAAYDDWVNSITVAEAVVYAVGHDGFVYALDAATGEQRWRSDRIGDRVVGNLTVDGGVVFVTGYLAPIEAGSVYALDGMTGETLWSEPEGRRTVGALVTADGVVYVSDFIGGNLYALDAATGTERWRLAIGVDISSLAVDSGTIYVGSDDGYVFAIGDTN